jgi:hypothetical protein
MRNHSNGIIQNYYFISVYSKIVLSDIEKHLKIKIFETSDLAMYILIKLDDTGLIYSLKMFLSYLAVFYLSLIIQRNECKAMMMCCYYEF